MILLQKFKIQGHSMSPKISEGNEILVSSIPFIFLNPRCGDVVAFKKGNKVFIKRIKKVEEDKYYLIGDNDKDSFDSRKFGSVYRKNVIGKVIMIL